jgi:hypothetical protein
MFYKLSKCTKWHIFHSKRSKLSFWVIIVVILSVPQHVTTVILFSAWDKSHVKWDGDISWTMTSCGHFLSKWVNSPTWVNFRGHFWDEFSWTFLVNSRGQKCPREFIYFGEFMWTLLGCTLLNGTTPKIQHRKWGPKLVWIKSCGKCLVFQKLKQSQSHFLQQTKNY